MSTFASAIVILLGAAAGVVAVVAAAGPVAFPRRRLAVTALGTAVAFIPFAIPVVHAGAGYIYAGVYAIGAVCVPAAALALVQLVAVIAGRGRPAPLGRFDPLIRAAIAFPWLAFVVRRFVDVLSGSPFVVIGLWYQLAAIFGSAALMAAAAFLAPRRGGESVLLPMALGLSTYGTLDVLDSRWSLSWMSVATIAVLPLLALVALRLYRIGRRELAMFGITAWAPADLALVPGAVFLAIYLATPIATGAPPPFESFFNSRPGLASLAAVAIVLAGAVPFFLALRYLRRRIDTAEARARAAAAPAPTQAT